MPEPAVLFRDRVHGDAWRVAIFSGPGAHQRAIRYADRQYGGFEEVDPLC
jgi:hypothetical protein